MQPPAGSRFQRSSDRILGGVCSGLGDALHVDPLWVRLAFVVLAFVQGIGILIYLALWILMPEEPNATGQRRENVAVLRDGLRSLWSGNDAGLWAGVVLIAAGAVLLAGNSGLVKWEVLWPVIVIALGGLLLVRSIQVRR